MIIGNDINTYANLTGTGLTGVILGINTKNYEINKDVLLINKKILDSTQKQDVVYEELLSILRNIDNKQSEIISLLHNSREIKG